MCIFLAFSLSLSLCTSLSPSPSLALAHALALALAFAIALSLVCGYSNPYIYIFPNTRSNEKTASAPCAIFWRAWVVNMKTFFLLWSTDVGSFRTTNAPCFEPRVQGASRMLCTTWTKSLGW